LVDNLTKRLNRISGQINGVNKMISDNRYCNDILIQISAIEKALKEVGFMILQNHMHTCVADDIKNNDFSSIDESLDIFKKLS
nr:metal-sensitive transcriptional regulator [Bacilli bacterium]